MVIAFVFNFLGTTADTYLAPSLEEITKKLKLSEAIAGVTLLALANGATDVIAGFVAGGKDSGGVTIAIGGLFGACLFTVTLVLARCIAGAGSIKVDAQGFMRDITFMLIATIYFIILLAVNKISWPMACGFFVIYIIFLSYVIWYEKHKQQVHTSYKNKLARVKARLLKKEEDPEDASKRKMSSLWETVLTPYLLRRIIRQRTKKGLKRGLSKSLTSENLGEAEPIEDVDKIKEEAMTADEEDEDNSTFGKIMRVYNAPLFFIRNITIIPFEAEHWNLIYAVVAPFFGLLFFLWQTGLIFTFDDHPYLWAIYGVIAFSISGFVFYKGRNENLAENNSGILATLALIVSALWLNLIANCFMDFLSLITVISGLPLNYLSLTMLAWGNSLDDFFIDYVIAKSGHGKMAVTGVYGGQLFNLLIGFGGAMVMQSSKNTIIPDVFDFSSGDSTVKTQNLLTIILLCSLLVELVLTLVVAKIKNWVLSKNMMWFLIIFYVTFLIAVTIIVLV